MKPDHPNGDQKLAALEKTYTLNTHPERVSDLLFTTGEPFFDPHDLVQVKYEMLRRVHYDGHAVNATAAAFGFSRPSFYAAQTAWKNAGFAGLIPARPGPRVGHKLTPEIVAFLRKYQLQHPRVSATRLVELLNEQFQLQVHPRSIERALARHAKEVNDGDTSEIEKTKANPKKA